MQQKNDLPKNKFQTRKIKNLIFYTLGMAFPIVQFLVFFVGVNFNSILLAFQNIDLSTGETTFAGLKNFEKAFFVLSSPELSSAFKNSLILFASNMFVAIPLALLCSYYIYKKKLMYGIFKVLIFMPSIISAVVLVMLYQSFLLRVLPDVMHLLGTNINNFYNENFFGLVVFFSIWMMISSDFLIFVGSMGAINPSLCESAQLDGATQLQEFWHIILPSCWPTIITYIIAGIVMFFTGEMNLFTFAGGLLEPRYYTYGYYFFNTTRNALLSEYTWIAALGLIFTLIVSPITFLTRKLCYKLGPRTD